MVDGGIHICYQLQPQTRSTQLGSGPDSTNIFAMSLHGPPRGAHPPTTGTVDPMYLSHNVTMFNSLHISEIQWLMMVNLWLMMVNIWLMMVDNDIYIYNWLVVDLPL